MHEFIVVVSLIVTLFQTEMYPKLAGYISVSKRVGTIIDTTTMNSCIVHYATEILVLHTPNREPTSLLRDL